MQYSLSKLSPALLTSLKHSIEDEAALKLFLSKLERFLDGEQSSKAGQDLAFSTGAELSASGILDKIPADRIAKALPFKDTDKTLAFKKGLAKRLRTALKSEYEAIEAGASENSGRKSVLRHVVSHRKGLVRQSNSGRISGYRAALRTSQFVKGAGKVGTVVRGLDKPVAQITDGVIFEVAAGVDKPQIKEAVETLFGVKVKAVNTSIAKGKVKRFRGQLGKRKDIKKAYVTLEEGNTIDVSTGL